MDDALEENTRDKIYIWLYDTTSGEKYIVEGNNIIYFFREYMREGGY